MPHAGVQRSFNFLRLSPTAWSGLKAADQTILDDVSLALTDNYKIPRDTPAAVWRARILTALRSKGSTTSLAAVDVLTGMLRDAYRWLWMSPDDRAAFEDRLRNVAGFRTHAIRNRLQRVIAGLKQDGITSWEEVQRRELAARSERVAERRAALQANAALDAGAAARKSSTGTGTGTDDKPVGVTDAGAGAAVAMGAGVEAEEAANAPTPSAHDDDGAEFLPEPTSSRFAAVMEELIYLAREMDARLHDAVIRADAHQRQTTILRAELEAAENRAISAREEALYAHSATIEQLAGAYPEYRDVLLTVAQRLGVRGDKQKVRRASLGLPYRFVWKTATGRIEYSARFIDALERMSLQDSERAAAGLKKFADLPTSSPWLVNSFQSEKIKRPGANSYPHTPAGANKSRLSGDLRVTWTHAGGVITMHYVFLKGEHVQHGAGEH